MRSDDAVRIRHMIEAAGSAHGFIADSAFKSEFQLCPWNSGAMDRLSLDR